MSSRIMECALSLLMCLSIISCGGGFDWKAGTDDDKRRVPREGSEEIVLSVDFEVPIEATPIYETSPQLESKTRFNFAEGTFTPAYCAGKGFVGYREYLGGGVFTRATCPNNEKSFNQEISTLVITTSQMNAVKGFNNLIQALGDRGVGVALLEDIMTVVSRPFVAESVRDFIEFAYNNELRNLKNVLFVGDIQYSPTGDITTIPPNDVMIPLKYVKSKAPKQDAAEEEYWVSSLYYGVPARFWDEDQGNKYWTPDFITHRMVDVGFIQVDGRQFCLPDGADPKTTATTTVLRGNPVTAGFSCITDVQIYAQKLQNWTIDETFVESQFDSGICWNEGGWDINTGIDAYNGISHQIKYHNCDTPDPIGDAGRFGVEDKATVLTVAGHGNSYGTQTAASNGEGWDNYYYNSSSEFGGAVYLFSCTVGAPDLTDISVIQGQLSNPKGAVAVVGHTRILTSPSFSPWVHMARYDWKTVGDAIYGTMYNHLSGYGTRSTFKAQSDTIIGGTPAIQLTKTTRGVKVISHRFNEDQSVDAHLVVRADPNEFVKIKAAGKHVVTFQVDADGWAWGFVHVDPGIMTQNDVFSIPCKVKKQSCFVGGFEVKNSIKVEVEDVIVGSEGNYDLLVSLDHHIINPGTEVVVELVTRECFDGPESTCFWEGSGTLYFYEIGSEVFDYVDGDGFMVGFSLSDFQQPVNEYVRALRVKIKHKDADTIHGIGHLKLDTSVLNKLRLF